MANLQDLIPPLELCKLIPKGEFEDTLYIWDKTPYFAFTDGINEEGKFIGGYGKVIPEFYKLRKNYNKTEKQVEIDFGFECGIEIDCYPAPMLQEILEDLHFFKIAKQCSTPWIEVDDFYGEKENLAESALMVWLENKGIKNG